MARVRATVLGTALLVLAAGCSPAEEPAPDALPEPDEPAPAEPDEGEPDEEGAEESLDEMLDRVGTEVADLRGLEWLDDVTTEVVAPEELAEIATERDLDDTERDDLDAWSDVLAALRHIPEGADLEELYDDLQASGIVGLYDPVDEIAYVSSEELPLGPAAQITTAHELLHALQDQHFDLSRLEDVEDDDEALAFLSVVEGDAVLIEDEWTARHLSPEEREQAEEEGLAAAMEDQETLAELPEYIIEGFLFPYTAGERFVTALREEGGFAAVDAAIEEPPTTTLEILDPDRYLEGFEPVDAETGSDPGEEWEPTVEGSFGAFELLALFGAVEDTDGGAAWPWWEGGAIEAWERNGDIALAAGWAFSEEEAATMVCTALPRWYVAVADGQPTDGSQLEEPIEPEDVGEEGLEGDRDAFAVRCDDRAVRFAIAPDAETAAAILDP